MLAARFDVAGILGADLSVIADHSNPPCTLPIVVAKVRLGTGVSVTALESRVGDMLTPRVFVAGVSCANFVIITTDEF